MGDNNGGVKAKTLGILFVHGIGVQRRGDTLVQCGDPMHLWLEAWSKGHPGFREHPVDIDFVETSLLSSGPVPESPAHTRMMFRQDGRLSRMSWVLAESCWAETYRPPSYKEFVRWAWSVVPFATFPTAIQPILGRP